MYVYLEKLVGLEIQKIITYFNGLFVEIRFSDIFNYKIFWDEKYHQEKSKD